MIDNVDKLAVMEFKLPGKAFDYKGDLYRCKEAKLLSSRKLVVTTMSRMLVLQESDLKDLIIRVSKQEKELTQSDLKSKVYQLEVKEVEQVIAKQPEVEDNRNKRWTVDEDSLIVAKFEGTIKIKNRELAEQLGRPLHCITQRAYALKKLMKIKDEAEEANMKLIDEKRHKQFRFVPTELEPDISAN